VARLCGGLCQALFWSIAAPTVAGLFPPERRGRAVARLSVGTSVAPVAGIPAGTWLGQQAGWRVTFLVLTGITLATAAAVVILLPRGDAAGTGTATGTEPDGRRYALLVVGTVAAVTGLETVFTYIAPFLLDVTGVGTGLLAPLLLVGGVCGFVGTLVAGRFIGAHPWRTMVIPLGGLTLALFGLWAGARVLGVAVAGLVLLGLSFSAFVAGLPNAALIVAPGSQDLASAGVNSAFNVGIASGSFLGGVLIGATGTRSIALVGAALTAVATAVLLGDGLLRPRPAVAPRVEPVPVLAEAD
jgi:DHA1 family L-arabinose/isopropyl-beta-D-thiogalactopyranoside export protein-like MFS transporter/DHA1 family inner membrane transport protein